MKEKLVHIKIPNTVTIGVFDGVHLGHEQVIATAISHAKKLNLCSTIISFYPHPKTVVSKQPAPPLLNTIEERIDRLKQFNADHLILEEFTPELAQLTASTFFEEVLTKTLCTKTLIIGHNQRIGSDQLSGKKLQELGREKLIEVILVDAYFIHESSISSSAIRSHLKEGNISLANRFLGYPYVLEGPVAKGAQIGQQIGFPTANLNIKDSNKLIPKRGAYLVRCTIKNTAHYGMMNIGVRPTVNNTKDLCIEIHLFNFSERLYGQVLKVEILSYLREEQKFKTLEDLKGQLEKDRVKCLEKIKDRKLGFLKPEF